MEKAFSFLLSHRDVAFATAEDGIPKIRVFQVMRQEGRSLYFATAPHKEIYRQLQANPHVELLAMEGNVSVRMGGRVRFDVPDAVCREIYDSNSVLSRLYADYASLAYFRLPVAWSDYFDLTPTPPLLEHEEYGEDGK